MSTTTVVGVRSCSIESMYVRGQQKRKTKIQSGRSLPPKGYTRRLPPHGTNGSHGNPRDIPWDQTGQPHEVTPWGYPLPNFCVIPLGYSMGYPKGYPGRDIPRDIQGFPWISMVSLNSNGVNGIFFSVHIMEYRYPMWHNVPWDTPYTSKGIQGMHIWGIPNGVFQTGYSWDE